MSSPDTATEAPPDEARAEVLAALTEHLGAGVVEHHLRPGDELWVRVTADVWAEAARVARSRCGLDYFCFLSGLDWLPSPFGRGEDDPTAPPPERSTVIEQGYAGGETRFQVFARLVSSRTRASVVLKVDVPDDAMSLPTWTHTYAGADWHEREAWEMFGVTFVGHPNLVHIYLPHDFEGYPLRKDFPLLARMIKPWPGIVDVEPLPGGDDEGGDE